MDATNMSSFQKDSFDVVIDKGTLDAVLADQESAWEVEENIAESCDQMLSEIYRVLKSQKQFIYITFGQPHFRKKLLLKEKFKWNLEQKTIGEFFHYFIYILKKE